MRLDKVAPAAANVDDTVGWMPAFLREQQMQDPDISPVIGWIEGQGWPEWDEVRPTSPFQCALWQQYN